MAEFIPKAFLFDLDGVLIDTEDDYSLFWRETLLRYNPDEPWLSDEIKGKTLDQILSDHIPPQYWALVRRGVYDFEANMEFRFFPGAIAFLRAIKDSGRRFAIVTSSDDIKVRQFAEKNAEVMDLADVIITGDHMRQSKPAPDCWWQAAEALGCPIEECAVFEDSPNGLQSARDSRAYVVGIVSTLPRERVEKYSDLVLDKVADFPL